MKQKPLEGITTSAGITASSCTLNASTPPGARSPYKVRSHGTNVSSGRWLNSEDTKIKSNRRPQWKPAGLVDDRIPFTLNSAVRNFTASGRTSADQIRSTGMAAARKRVPLPYPHAKSRQPDTLLGSPNAQFMTCREIG